MYKKMILRGARFGLLGGLSLCGCYAILVAILMAISTSNITTAVSYFFLFLFLGILFGSIPSALVGAISGMLVGSLVFLENKYLGRLGKVRVGIWRAVGLASLVVLLITAYEYRHWLMNSNNIYAALFVGLYFSGLIWAGWRLYRSLPSDQAGSTPTRQVPLAQSESKNLSRPTPRPSAYKITINVVSIFMGLCLSGFAVLIVANMIRNGGIEWLGQLAALSLGVCCLVCLRTMDKWGV